MTTQCAKVSRLKRPIPADLLLHIEQKLLRVRSSVTDCVGERIRRWNLGDSAGSARHSVAVEQVGGALRLIRLRSQSCTPRDIAGYVKVRVGCVLVTEDTEVRANNQGGKLRSKRRSAGAQISRGAKLLYWVFISASGSAPLLQTGGGLAKVSTIPASGSSASAIRPSRCSIAFTSRCARLPTRGAATISASTIPAGCAALRCAAKASLTACWPTTLPQPALLRQMLEHELIRTLKLLPPAIFSSTSPVGGRSRTSQAGKHAQSRVYMTCGTRYRDGSHCPNRCGTVYDLRKHLYTITVIGMKSEPKQWVPYPICQQV